MTHGILLSNKKHKLIFMNTALKSFLISVMKYDPKFCYRFNIEDTDFIGNEELLNLKIFVKKDDMISSCNYMNLSSIFEINEIDPEMDAYSINDFVKLA